MSITYQRETFADAVEEAMPLLEAHWQELGTAQHGESLSLDHRIYTHVEANNSLLVITARDDGALVGYSSAFIHQGLHCAWQKQSTQDVFYVSPAYRGGMIGMRLLRLTEKHLKQEGVEIMLSHANVKNMLLGKLLEAVGHEPASVGYLKRLK